MRVHYEPVAASKPTCSDDRSLGVACAGLRWEYWQRIGRTEGPVGRKVSTGSEGGMRILYCTSGL
jgi:hypothetical protein